MATHSVIKKNTLKQAHAHHTTITLHKVLMLAMRVENVCYCTKIKTAQRANQNTTESLFMKSKSFHML